MEPPARATHQPQQRRGERNGDRESRTAVRLGKPRQLAPRLHAPRLREMMLAPVHVEQDLLLRPARPDDPLRQRERFAVPSRPRRDFDDGTVLRVGDIFGQALSPCPALRQDRPRVREQLAQLPAVPGEQARGDGTRRPFPRRSAQGDEVTPALPGSGSARVRPRIASGDPA